MTAVAMSIEELTRLLSVRLQRDVIDETGLTGKYDFHLEYADDGAMGAAMMRRQMPIWMNPTTTDASGPTIFSKRSRISSDGSWSPARRRVKYW
jgi:uncharacterized protein (TIGR03435 family)